jgi:hypothetical protein
MTESQIILNMIGKYLEDNPEIRFMQALTNLNINQFADIKEPGSKNWLLRDPYYDTDKKVLERIVL